MKELELERINKELEDYTPQEIIRWGYETFGNQLSMLSSMQRTASCLIHMVHAEGLHEIEILFVDTGYHFKETLELRDRMVETYGVKIKTLYPKFTPEEQFRRFGRELYLRDGDYQYCCKMRKEEPFLEAAQSYEALLSGLMRSEGGARKHIPIISVDPRIDGYRIHPLANWTREKVDKYNRENEVLVHPLHFRGYPSIGCQPCTTPVKIGEDERAGRWRHIREACSGGEQKLYCGINFSDTREASGTKKEKEEAKSL